MAVTVVDSNNKLIRFKQEINRVFAYARSDRYGSPGNRDNHIELGGYSDGCYR
jgi:hypothetical protein